MSCPEAWQLGVYVDGELEANDLREIEGHLVGCEACRRHVLDLQTEARLIADVVADRPAPAAPAVVASSAQGLAIGVPATLGLLGAALAVLTTLVDSPLPSGTEWLRPARWFGVNDMILDVLFTLRDQAPGALEFALAIAATASVAALATLAARLLGRRVEAGPLWSALLVLAPLAVLLAAPSARAGADIRTDQPVHILADEVIEDTLVTSGDSLIVEGTVKGDVLAFGERVAIRGRVEGSVFLAGREVEISGTVLGNAHVFSAQARVEGEIGKGLYAGADRFVLTDEASVGRSALAVGDRVVVEGQVALDGYFFAGEVELGGSVGRDLEFGGETLRLLAGSRVGRDLTARVGEAERVRIDPGALVAGEQDVREDMRVQHALEDYSSPRFYVWRVVWLVAAFALGMALFLLLPGLFEGRVATAPAFFRALGLGFAALVLTPIAVVVIALTVVGIPLAVLGAGLYLSAFYLSHLCVAALVGASLVHPAGSARRRFAIAFLVGLVALTVAYHLPIFGGLLRFVGLLLGLGLLLDRIRVVWDQRFGGAEAPA